MRRRKGEAFTRLDLGLLLALELETILILLYPPGLLWAVTGFPKVDRMVDGRPSGSSIEANDTIVQARAVDWIGMQQSSAYNPEGKLNWKAQEQRTRPPLHPGQGSTRDTTQDMDSKFGL